MQIMYLFKKKKKASHLNLCKCFTSTHPCTIRSHLQCIHSEHVNILSSSLQQTQISILSLPCVPYCRSSSSHNSLLLPSLPSSQREFILNFACHLIKAADCRPACCPAPITHILGAKRIIHYLRHMTKELELKEQLLSHG